MRVEPASIEQIRQAGNGRLVLISADAGGVADELRRIDPHLKVRFAELSRPPVWCVYHESDDGRETTLVATAPAYQQNSGVWAGLDHRIVDEVLRRDKHRGYDRVADVNAENDRKRKERQEALSRQVGDGGERLAHAIRKDLGMKGRAFIGEKP